MSRDIPALADPWRLVESRQGFQGTWPVAKFERLADALADRNGEVSFTLTFGVDASGYAYVDVSVLGHLTLECQRSMEKFQYPVDRRVRLGLIADEADAAALPEDYEPLLVDSPPIRLVDLVEDELILALPVVPRKPGVSPPMSFGPDDEAPMEPDESPFAALKELKSRSD
ncbi:MAG: YceD family protein [Xanthomonadales bacterium]|nr:YceD family protein [Xanthomonadales bacterium]